MRCLYPLALVFLMVGGGVSLSLAQVVAGAERPPTVAEQYLFAQANAERAQRGLPALRWNAALYKAAGAHAQEMAARASISHQYAGEPELAERGRNAGARFSMIAENVAEAPTALRVHNAWMNSAGHRANILSDHVDAVGISVLRRDGQLYAVEDFSHTVEVRSLADQELVVQTSLGNAANLTVLPTTDETRRTCAMESGYAGPRRPWFVMRYTTADLTKIPEQLKTQLDTGRYREAQIGACMNSETEAFSSFKLAVLLYP